MSSPIPEKTSQKKTNQEDVLDLTLRPNKWEDYIGQEKIKQNLKIIITAAKERKENPEHLLFYGNSGLGKTTLAHLVSKEINSDIKITSGPAIEKAGDLAAILTNLSEGSVLFIDECHRLNRIIEEYIYPAMEEFQLNLILGKGAMARTMTLPVPRFTLIAATTRLAAVSAPLRSRFGAIFGLNFYEVSDIEKILQRSSQTLKIETDSDALKTIARSSRFTPRAANHLLKRIRDFAQIKREKIISKKTVDEALVSMEIDKIGLTLNDVRILETIIKKFNGGPVGLQAIAAATGEEEDTILDIYEPYLMRLGFIERTPRGRTTTKLASQHLGIKFKNPQNSLL